ncbi:MCE family protein [Mycolicibacterium helvum]|uniref:Mammalian cell entry protein n=1 Tax=Mycolicibacterium helvum TaxID=1534349 RepID=A0A7I7T6S8_9MYCO|nr:MlaD family protein [Mycolicibacterium helvum]BBY64974.1 mammalian cell entry protein [Mycolicibacterium helvum]
MNLTRFAKIQLAVFTVVACVVMTIMAVGYMKLPAQLFGLGRYTVTVQLHRSAGLYPRANVTYRGTEVGRVDRVTLTPAGAEAVLSLNSGIKVPADVDAEVHSQSAIGELYVALLPRSTGGEMLADGDVIPVDRTSVPPDIGSLLDATNRGLAAVPKPDLRTVIDESYTAVGGLGPELARIVKGGTQLALDAKAELDSMVALIKQSKPVLDAHAETADEIGAWAANLATITGQLRNHDSSLRGLLANTPAAAEEARSLIERLRPTLPVLLANLVSVNQVAISYQPALEQLLVLLPQAVAMMGALAIGNLDTKQDYTGMYLDFNLNLNLPPPCNTGFLPAQQQRSPALEDYPDRPAGSLYCRVPQDHPYLAVRGMRNLPCLTVPGKRAPTVEMCESDQQYVPLNDGSNWKGDPNATTTGQSVPQESPAVAQADSSQKSAVPVGVARYDPETGDYLGLDGRLYSQANLAATMQQPTLEKLLLPEGAG